jgi:hypothetical protein
MKFVYNQGTSISKLIKALIASGNPTKEHSLANGLTIGGEPLNPHSFSLNESLNFLTYEVQRNNGDKFLQQWYVISEASNLPNVESVRYYLLSNGKRISKLHIYAFSDCVCLFSRLDYKHWYYSQSYSKGQQGFKHHDYRRKIDRLIKSKKRLVCSYNGKQTRTSKKIDHYLQLEDHYDDLASKRLGAFYLKYCDKV